MPVCQAVGCGATGLHHRLPGFRAVIHLCPDCARVGRVLDVIFDAILLGKIRGPG